MADLNDYSGEFNPNLKLSDFSVRFLKKLLIHRLGAKDSELMQDSEQFPMPDPPKDYFIELLAKLGWWMYQKSAMEVWVPKIFSGETNVMGEFKRDSFQEHINQEVKATADLANIRLTTILDFIKVWQLTGDGVVFNNMLEDQPNQSTWEIKNPNHFISTIWKCPVLELMEENPEMYPPEFQRDFCEWDRCLAESIWSLAPFGVEVVGLKLPPRKNKTEAFCMLEYKKK